MLTKPPLALYVHTPWCERKCPYCDFNSHQLNTPLPHREYIRALLADLDADINATVVGRTVGSIFIGGGTPSLFPGKAIELLIKGIAARLSLATDCEITLEVNPGSALYQCFAAYRKAGATRLSIGVQSFNDDHLRQLGRIHTSHQAHTAIEAAQRADFARLNVDLMYGLPQQSAVEALSDVQMALDHGIKHLSHYQLTIEPHTAFSRSPPQLPDEGTLQCQFNSSRAVLQQYGLQRYEVSAFATAGHRCRHNINYWRYGDYLGIGAGACSKITHPASGTIMRTTKHRSPRVYLAATCGSGATPIAKRTAVTMDERVFEFAMNALRLRDGFRRSQFSRRTGVAISSIEPIISTLVSAGLLRCRGQQITTTALGFRFLNDTIAHFLPAKGDAITEQRDIS